MIGADPVGHLCLSLDKEGVVQLGTGIVGEIVEAPVGLGINLSKPNPFLDGCKPQVMARIDG